MLHLSVAQALDVWTELEDAYQGVNRFGNDTAEIYAYRLQPHSNMEASAVKALRDGVAVKDSIALETMESIWRNAAESLVMLVEEFCKRRDVMITIDEMSPREWLQEKRFHHRCRVTVIIDQES